MVLGGGGRGVVGMAMPVLLLVLCSSGAMVLMRRDPDEQRESRLKGGGLVPLVR